MEEENGTQRGSRTRRKYGALNKFGCPENAIPLWQAVNPFTTNLSRDDKDALFKLVASKTEQTRKSRGTGEIERYYVFFDHVPPLGTEIRKFRDQVYSILPDTVLEKLPPAITAKYGSNHK
jgi:hypothetical protein